MLVRWLRTPWIVAREDDPERKILNLKDPVPIRVRCLQSLNPKDPVPRILKP